LKQLISPKLNSLYYYFACRSVVCGPLSQTFVHTNMQHSSRASEYWAMTPMHYYYLFIMQNRTRSTTHTQKHQVKN